jgi:TPR repeat protein
MYLSTSSTTQTGSNADMLQLGNFAFQEQRYDDALNWYLKAATQGKAKAQFQLAQMYIKGQGTEPNDVLALHWIKAAAAQGLRQAEYTYATMLEFGRGMERPQPKKALAWYQKAAEHQHPAAMLKLAKLLNDDKTKADNIYQALRWVVQAESIPTTQNEAKILRKSIVNTILKKARNHDSHAQFEVALMYQKGQGIQADENKTLYWLKEAAKQGHTKAQFVLGKTLSNTASSQQEGLYWLTLAAQKGNEQAGYALAAIMGQQTTIQNNAQEAWRWLYHGMRNKDAQSLYNLAVTLKTGKLDLPKTEKHVDEWLSYAAEHGVVFAQNDAAVSYVTQHKKVKTSLKWLNNAANANDVLSQFNLGLLFARGEGFSPSDEKALAWWKLAEKNGSTKAPMMLGLFYHIGRGTGRDEKAAVSWYEKAIALGDSDALYNLAMIYYQGRGVNQDYKKAAHYLEQLANQDDAQAQNIYASLFLDGKGVQYSPQTATIWFKKAAQSGNINAMFNLATAYRSGTGVAQNDKKALYWYQKAAEKNFAPAENAVGYMYAEGRDVKKDTDQAEVWFNRASEHGLRIAQQNLNVLRHQGSFSLVTLQIQDNIRDSVLSDKHIDLSAWLEVHHQPVL